VPEREKAFGPCIISAFTGGDVRYGPCRADFTWSNALERTVARTYCRDTTTSSCPTAPTLLLARRDSRGATFSIHHSPDSFLHPSLHAILPTRSGSYIPRPSRPDRHPRLDTPHRPLAATSTLPPTTTLLPTRLATPLRRPAERISLPASLLQESAPNSTYVSELDLASHCIQDKAVAVPVPALSKRQEEGLRILTGRVCHCRRYQLSVRQA
jgi:hypothetical protein